MQFRVDSMMMMVVVVVGISVDAIVVSGIDTVAVVVVENYVAWS